MFAPELKDLFAIEREKKMETLKVVSSPMQNIFQEINRQVDAFEEGIKGIEVKVTELLKKL